MDLENWSDLMARSMYGAGVRPGDIVHNAYGYGLFTGGLGAHYGAERLGAVVVPVSGGGTERQVGLIQDFGATVLCATPSYALAIAESASSRAWTCAEQAARGPVRRRALQRCDARGDQERLGVKAGGRVRPVRDHGPGVACECSLQQGLHGWEDHFLFEIIDPDTGKPAPEGQAGELVITTLTKQALPMLRYRTRDITRFTTNCACGRPTAASCASPGATTTC